MQGDRDLQQRAQALYRRQSEAEAGTFAGPGRAVRLVELLEHARPMLVRDARSRVPDVDRSEEHTSELQSLMRISYAVFCLKKKKKQPSNRTVYEAHRS